MTRPAIGTYAWCEAGATLDARDKVSAIRDLVRVQVGELLERSGMVDGRLRVGRARCSFDAVVWPDSPMAIAALEHARATCHPTVFEHCLRTYAFGCLFAQTAALPVDAELMFVAAVLHDLGISRPYIEGAHRLCFATIGARLAADFVSGRGWDADRTRRTYECISLHFNSIIDDRAHGAEARFVGEGASLDVLGLRVRRLPMEEVRAVSQRHSRSGFAQEIARANAAARHPANSRPGYLGGPAFNWLVRHNPLEREAQPGQG